MLRIKKSARSGPPFLKVLVLTFVVYISFYMQVAYADIPDVGTMLTNFAETVPEFMRLVTASAYVMGMFFIYKGIHSLKEFGETRTASSTSEHGLKGALILITVGTLLLYLPSAVETGLSTFWSDANPYGYIDESTDQWSVMYQTCFLIIQLIGTVSFIRGLLILSTMSGSTQQGTLGRGLTHIIAGVLCINLYDFLNAINATLGITGVISSHT
jgi:intracellular multiplication protein IcmC